MEWNSPDSDRTKSLHLVRFQAPSRQQAQRSLVYSRSSARPRPPDPRVRCGDRTVRTTLPSRLRRPLKVRSVSKSATEHRTAVRLRVPHAPPRFAFSVSLFLLCSLRTISPESCEGGTWFAKRENDPLSTAFAVAICTREERPPSHARWLAPLAGDDGDRPPQCFGGRDVSAQPPTAGLRETCQPRGLPAGPARSHR